MADKSIEHVKVEFHPVDDNDPDRGCFYLTNDAGDSVYAHTLYDADVREFVYQTVLTQ